MQVQGPSQLHFHGAHELKGPSANRAAGQAGAASGPAAQLDISPAGQAAAEAVERGELRSDLVARVRSEIAAGTYESGEKLDVALDRLLNEIG